MLANRNPIVIKKSMKKLCYKWMIFKWKLTQNILKYPWSYQQRVIMALINTENMIDVSVNMEHWQWDTERM